MSVENDLALAYHMGYDDALAKRKPDASKAQVLAPYDLATENAKLRELVYDMWDFFCVVPEDEPHAFKEELDFSVEVWRRTRELGVEVDG